MADYIYLLENRLSPAQRAALRTVREVARGKGLTVFLVGGAVRDLTSGSPIRDLDVVVQGNALKLKKDIEKAGGIITGETDTTQALFVRFDGNVRMEIGSTLSVTFPKPGKPVFRPATILDDLRRRDFTANAMALSINDGSYGLLMDPLNGVADIENRQLRLVSNYGFIEDPVRMVRAARLMARLGWTMDEKTQARYETGKQEDYISAMQDFHRGYETEEIVHEEDPLRVLKGLEAEGWMKYLAPFWTTSKVNVAELERLRETQSQLQLQNLHPATAAANFPLLTAKLSSKEIGMLKSSFPRQGFVAEIDALEGEAKEFAAQLSGKGAAAPSQAWKLLTSARPEAVLWVAFSSKSPAVQAKFKSFSTEWPQARQKMPYPLMQEMRIVSDLAGYEELLEKLFFELMDGRLTTPEEMRAFLEPYSPPAPPPPMSMRRLRSSKKEAKPAKSRSKKATKVDVEASASETADGEPIVSSAVPAEIPAIVSAKPKGSRKDVVGAKSAPTKPTPKVVVTKAAGSKTIAATKAKSVPAKPTKASARQKIAVRSPKRKSVPNKLPVAAKKTAPSKSSALGKKALKKAVSAKTAPPKLKVRAKVTAPTRKAPAKSARPSPKQASKVTSGKLKAKVTAKGALKRTTAPKKKSAVVKAKRR